MSPRLEIFTIYKSIFVWPILKPAAKFFCSVESKTKLHFFI